MKIVFMGTPSYATRILEALVNDALMDVVLLVSQEDKPVGRKQLLTPPHTKAWVLENAPSIDIYQPKSLRLADAWEKIASYKPDFIVVAAYGKLLPKEVLDIAPCINLHASLLPKYRGASPIQSTVLHNEAYAGVTSMLMEEGLDTGAMLGFSYYAMGPSDTASLLFEILAKRAAELTLHTLKQFSSLAPITQRSLDASHCKKITKEEGAVSFDETAHALFTKYRALTPWPGIFLPTGLKLLDIEYIPHSPHQAPSRIETLSQEGVSVACKEDVLLLKSVQAPSKNAMPAVEYARGKRLGLGDALA